MCIHTWNLACMYGVATISRLLKIIGLFAEYHLFYRALLQKRPIILRSLLIIATPYECIHTLYLTCLYYRVRRPTGCLKLQVIFRKRATSYRALLRKMTCTGKASYGSSLPCSVFPLWTWHKRVNVCMNVYYERMYECIHMLHLHVLLYSHMNVCMSKFACCTYLYECIHIWMYVVVHTHFVPNMYVWMYVKVYTMNICMNVFTCCTYMYGYIHIWTCVVVYSHSVPDKYVRMYVKTYTMNICMSVFTCCTYTYRCIHIWMYACVFTHFVLNTYIWVYSHVVPICVRFAYECMHACLHTLYLTRIYECIHMLYLYVWDSHMNVCMRVYTLCN